MGETRYAQVVDVFGDPGGGSNANLLDLGDDTSHTGILMTPKHLDLGQFVTYRISKENEQVSLFCKALEQNNLPVELKLSLEKSALDRKAEVAD